MHSESRILGAKVFGRSTDIEIPQFRWKLKDRSDVVGVDLVEIAECGELFVSPFQYREIGVRIASLTMVGHGTTAYLSARRQWIFVDTALPAANQVDFVLR